MNASIITIGDEILIGQIVDTNAAWMAQELNLLGISVTKIITCSDGKADILTALEEASSVSEIVLITGGLGPTKDDITKQALAHYFNIGMEFSQDTYDHIQFLIEKYHFSMTDGLQQQCYMPKGAKLLMNKVGTAPGMWFDFNNKVYVSMPGVPYEMEYLMNNEVLPLLADTFTLPAIYHKTILTSGLGESSLAENIKDIEAALPSNVKLAYLPGIAQVRLRLSGFGEDASNIKQLVETAANKITERLGHKIVYGYGNSSLPKALLTALDKHQLKLATAESCTGGLIGHQITSIPGASSSYLGGIIAYSNEIKEQKLGVQAKTLAQHGAVSEETVIEMAKGVIQQFQSDIGISISGIAGPGGGTPDKPVGTIWICIASKEQHYTKLLTLEGNRTKNIQYSANVALRAARQFILKNNDKINL